MAEHKATISWKNEGPDLLKGKYSRVHRWTFDGGLSIEGSASPAVVPAPYSSTAAIDPEEAFVAAISSCHMLTFVWLASRQGFQVDSYEDQAVGVTKKNEKGATWVATVTLRPKLVYGGDKRPSADEEERLHHAAHEQCYISSSVKTEVLIEAPAA
jgi:organic hydroperoxide reductase OsmC/OhrA